jgi:hypothetical protein
MNEEDVEVGGSGSAGGHDDGPGSTAGVRQPVLAQGLHSVAALRAPSPAVVPTNRRPGRGRAAAPSVSSTRMRRIGKWLCHGERCLGGGEPGNGSEGLAASLVSGGTWRSHQDASFRAGRLGVVGPIFGNGFETPSSSGHTPPPPGTTRRTVTPRPNRVDQTLAVFRRAPSGTKPVVT